MRFRECRVHNTIVINGDSMRAVTKVRSWNKEHKLYVHIYYSTKKAFQRREELYEHVAILREDAKKSPFEYTSNSDFTKYLNIRKSERTESGYTVSIREDVINKKIETAGWLIIISNDIDNAKEAMYLYREKMLLRNDSSDLRKV
jgi:hypothetical protein